MHILLLGEYSNVHWTLAQGLRALGHEVVVVSDGDGWKDYRRDINLKRSSLNPLHTLLYYARAWNIIRKMRGFDIVQLINPMFLELRAPRLMPFYRYLRRHNRRIVMGAFGMDHYWVKTCLDCQTFRYSDFNIGRKARTDEPFNQTFIYEWLDGEKGVINKHIARDCDAIVTGLCEYDMCYRPLFPDKTTFIPMPINMEGKEAVEVNCHTPLRIFIGIQRTRSQYKGTDIMLRALERVKRDFPDLVEIVRVESVPFHEYVQLMEGCDLIVDQLYSYTPAMNALEAMSKGLAVIGGGEPENYEILGETELRPIANVLPFEDECYIAIKNLIHHPDKVEQMKRDSILYVQRHHDHIKVAQQYAKLYSRLL